MLFIALELNVLYAKKEFLLMQKNALIVMLI